MCLVEISKGMFSFSCLSHYQLEVRHHYLGLPKKNTALRKCS